MLQLTLFRPHRELSGAADQHQVRTVCPCCSLGSGTLGALHVGIALSAGEGDVDEALSASGAHAIGSPRTFAWRVDGDEMIRACGGAGCMREGVARRPGMAGGMGTDGHGPTGASLLLARRRRGRRTRCRRMVGAISVRGSVPIPPVAGLARRVRLAPASANDQRTGLLPRLLCGCTPDPLERRDVPWSIGFRTPVLSAEIVRGQGASLFVQSDRPPVEALTTPSSPTQSQAPPAAGCQKRSPAR